MLECEADGWTHAARGTSTHGIYHQHGYARASQRLVDLNSRAGFFNSQTGEFFTHGKDHDLRVHGRSLSGLYFYIANPAPVALPKSAVITHIY